MTGIHERPRFGTLNSDSTISPAQSSTKIRSIYICGLIRRLAPAALRYSLCVLLLFSIHASAKGGARLGASDKIAGEQSQMLATELKTEHLKDPLGIETPRPRFNWLLAS